MNTNKIQFKEKYKNIQKNILQKIHKIQQIQQIQIKAKEQQIITNENEKNIPKQNIIAIHKKNKLKKNKFAIMAIFRDEEEYMEEWINHHIDQGVEKIYLYCNDPEKNKYNFLSKYIKYVVFIDWVKKINHGVNTIQKQAYWDCINRHGHKYNYIMMLDLDEFIININKNERVIDYLNTLKLSEIKALKIPRYNFGSNGHITKPDGKVMDNYKMHEKVYSSFKTIANSDYIDKKKRFYSVHDFTYLNKNGKIYNSFLSPIKSESKNERGNKNETPLVINHYDTKSHEEYFKRAKNWENGGINPISYRKNSEEEFIKRDKNEIGGYDYI